MYICFRYNKNAKISKKKKTNINSSVKKCRKLKKKKHKKKTRDVTELFLKSTVSSSSSTLYLNIYEYANQLS